MYHIDRLNIIELGVFRENNRPVEIDVGSWLDQQPDLAFEIVLRKPSANTTYLVSPMLGDRTLTWIVTEGDVAAVGYGEGQIRAYVGGTKWKTKVFKTHIYESMTGADTGDAPSESQSWVDDTAAKALKAEGFAVGKQSGSDVGSTSPYYHNNSKYYSEVAGAQASTATTKAGEAASSATAAAGSATAAAGSATAAAGSATSAANSATAAAGSATAASNSATAAESAETTALAYKDTTKTLHDNVVEMEAYTQTLQGWASQSEIAAEGYRDQCASLKDDCQALHGSVQVYHQAIGGMCDTVVAKAGEVETNAATASAKATAAAGSATSAAGSATTATNKAIEASASAATASSKATAAAGSATSAAKSAAAAQAVKDSIPEDYTALTGRVSQLQEKATKQAGTNATFLKAISNKADEDDFEELQGTVNGAVKDIDNLEKQQQSLKANIDTKASKKSLANTDRRLQAMYDLQNGQTWSMMTDEDADNPKASPDGSALATVTECGGKTVAWNQLIDKSKFGASSGVFTNNGDGSITLNGTCESVEQITLGYANLVSGHKYYCPVASKTEIGFSSSSAFGTISNYFFTANSTIGSGKVYLHLDTVIVETTSGKQYPTYDNVKLYPHLIDLTQMFGSGNEPTSTSDEKIKWVESYAATHPAYNEGELVSADVSAVESVGKNLFNQTESFKQKTYVGTYEVGTAKLIAGESYKPSFVYEDGYIGEGSYELIYFGVTQATTVNVKHWNSYFTPSETNVYKVFVYQNGKSTHGKIAGIQVEKGTTANSYVPYKSTTFTLPTAVRTQYPLRSAGTVYDEIVYDGKKWWHVKKIGTVDLGAQTWHLIGSNNHFYCSTEIPIKGPISVAERVGYILCAKYQTTDITDKWVEIAWGESNKGFLYIKDTSYSTSDEFKTGNNGVNLYYELATTVTTDITDLMQDWDGTLPTETGGTITFVCDDYTLWQVPNTVEYAVRLSDVVGG